MRGGNLPFLHWSRKETLKIAQKIEKHLGHGLVTRSTSKKFTINGLRDSLSFFTNIDLHKAILDMVVILVNKTKIHSLMSTVVP